MHTLEQSSKTSQTHGASEKPKSGDAAPIRRSPLLALQRTVGNQAVQRMVQAQRQVGASNDPAEREADHVAEQVLRSSGMVAPPCACGECPKCHSKPGGVQTKRLQASRSSAPADHTPSAPSQLDSILQSPGQPLETTTRERMERQFGQDFSGVRLHTDRRAAESAQEIQANAYTVGQHIVFGQNRYAPDSPSGQRLLAHELTHVVQQSGQSESLIQRDETAAPQPEPLEKRVESFKQTVRMISISRVRKNKQTLDVWRVFLENILTPRQVMGQALGTEAERLYATARATGTMELFGQWTETENPGYRYLYQEQIHGRARACTGCHLANMAWGLERKDTRDWQTPSAQLADFSRDFEPTAPSSAQANQADPNARPTCAYTNAELQSYTNQYSGIQSTLNSLQRIQPFLHQLGPDGYQVLPAEIMNKPTSPEQLVGVIGEHITSRQNDYDEFIRRIESGDVSYLRLEKVLDMLLPTAEPDVKRKIEAERESYRTRRAIEDAILTIAKIALMLLIIFPPTSAIGIGIGLVGGGIVLAGGIRDVQEGRMLSLTRGLDDVVPRTEQDRAAGLIFSGVMDIISGALAMAGGVAGLNARLSAPTGSNALALSGRSPLAARTINQNGWRVTFTADGASAVATNALFPRMVVMMDQAGMHLFELTGNGMRLVASRAWAEVGGVASAAGSSSTAMVPYGSGGMTVSSGSGGLMAPRSSGGLTVPGQGGGNRTPLFAPPNQTPLFPISRPPLLLTAGNDPALARWVAARDAINAEGGWINKMGAGGEASAELMLTQGGAGPTYNLNQFTPNARNFPLLDIISNRGMQSVKVKSVHRELTDSSIRSYARDLRAMLDPTSSKALSAAQTLQTNQGALQSSGQWPTGLPAGATQQQIVQYVNRSGELMIPDDHVTAVQNYVRQGATTFPQNYYLDPQSPTLAADIEALVQRVRPLGLRSDQINQLVNASMGQ